jgi:predicted dehydrogenase
MANRVLRMGMVGGGQGAFIGGVHRMAARLDNSVEFVAGALSSTSERSKESGRALGLDAGRIYGTWEEMVAGEKARPRDDRVDFVSIVAPNDCHYPCAKGFVEAGFNVVLDKPMVHTSTQARELIALVRKTGVIFAVTYNYSGYPMVKQAREMVHAGEFGVIRKVIVEYNQGWLATKLEDTGQKQADWRTDPTRSGVGGAIGDIGSHAEQLVHYVTGLHLESICADLTTFVPDRRLDDDANLLLRFAPRNGDEPGARGVLTASQVCIGRENDLRLRVYGDRGGLEWRQEEPNTLTVHALGEPDRIFRRGNDNLAPEAAAATRLPPGHPEAFIEAFANIYRGVCSAIRHKQAGKAGGGEAYLDYPTVLDGARGVHFIEKAVKSAASDQKWTDARWAE